MSGPAGSSQWMYQAEGYQIENSCRFDDGGTPKLTNTPSNASNRRTFTWSSWVKRSSINGTHVLFGALDASGRDNIYFQDTDKFVIEIMGTVSTTTQVFRDLAAWYHIVVVVDTTQGTNTNRIKLYVNGARVTDFSTGPAYPSQDTDGDINNNVLHVIGKDSWASRTYHFDGYLSEVHFVDGTAYQADSFGEFNKYGQWVPIKPQVTYGTNGFSMLFNSSGNLGLTGVGGATDVGSNYGVTNLAAHDQMNDTPTNNFNVNNPLDEDYASNRTFSEGNLYVDSPTTNHGSVRGTMAMSSGKWYMEWCNPTLTDGNKAVWCGVCANDTDLTVFRGVNIVNQTASNGRSIVRDDAVTDFAEAAVWAAGTVLSAAIDMDNRKIWLGINNTYYGSGENTNGDPAGAANPTHTLAADQTPDGSLYSFSGGYDLEIVSNFGQDSSFAGTKTAQGNTDDNGRGDFFYAPPDGFLALCTKNLPEPENNIIASENFNTILYTGDDQTGKAISGVGFAPDFLWFKERNNAAHHVLHDKLRGASGGRLSSNRNNAEDANNSIASFDSDGFTVGASAAYINSDSATIVAWNWKANGSGGSDTNGSINTTATSANVDAGISIVSYTVSGEDAHTTGHGLSKAPELILWKSRDRAASWSVYAKPIGNAKKLVLDTTGAEANTGGWNSTTPSSTLVYHGGYYDADKIIYYAFHSVDGFSKVGSYIGNGNANGAFVHTGFRPAWVMLKKTGNDANGSSWCIHDNKRVGYNNVNERLRANTNGVEDDDGRVELLSNGFKMRVTYQESNEADVEFIYLAFAETPFKYSNAR